MVWCDSIGGGASGQATSSEISAYLRAPQPNKMNNTQFWHFQRSHSINRVTAKLLSTILCEFFRKLKFSIIDDALRFVRKEGGFK